MTDLVAMKVIRETLLLFGCDVSDLSDAELEERILEGNKAISNCGVTTETAMKNVTLALKSLY